MRTIKTLIIIFLLSIFLFSISSAGERNADVFSSFSEKESFAKDVSGLIGNAWKKWQDEVIINGIEVEGANGFLSPGDLCEPVLKKNMILSGFNTDGRSYEYIECLKTVVDGVAEGMRLWQHGYSNRGIPFPQGASCNFTLPECKNIPVSLASGSSLGDNVMTEGALYNYMIYHTSFHSKNIYSVYRATAKAIAGCFDTWRKNCFIVDICASGGIAPGVGPMGATPGPVRGAKGSRGKLRGKPFCSEKMFETMMTYFREQEK